MADINIYGTLKNVTGEPIVRAEQVAGVGEISQSAINENLMAGKRYEGGKWVPNKSEVYNDLDSSDGTIALAAAQGKVLKGKIDTLTTTVSGKADSNVVSELSKKVDVNNTVSSAIAAAKDSAISTIRGGDDVKYQTLKDVEEVLGQTGEILVRIEDDLAALVKDMDVEVVNEVEQAPNIAYAINKAKNDITTAYTQAIEDAIGVVLNTPL